MTNEYFDKIDAELCKRDFFHFIKEFWSVTIPEDPVYNWHIPYIAKELQSCAERVIRGDNNEYDLLINIPPGTTKCVCGDEYVFTERGMVKAKEVNIKDVIYSHRNGQLFKQNLIALESYEKLCVEIETKLHNKIKVSYDHPVLTHKGWKKACDLDSNDYLISLCCEIDGDNPICDYELDLITLLLFEGGLTGGSRKFSSDDKEVLDILYRACNKLGFIVNKVKGSSCDYSIRNKKGERFALTSLLKKYGICDKLAINKNLPSQFFQIPLKQKHRFISLMIATDGYISKKGGVIGVCLGSKELIKEIQLLLMTCGIPSSFHERDNGFAGAYRLTINGEDAENLLGKIDCLQKQKDFLDIFKKKRYSLSHGYPYEVTKGLTYKFRKVKPKINVKKKGCMITNNLFNRMKTEIDSSLSEWDMDDFIYDRVLKVENIHKQKVFHFQVESKDYDSQNFIANGLVTHNTTICIVMYPVWIWLKYPEARILTLNYSATGATEKSVLSKDIIKSDKFKRYFPNLEIRGDIDNKETYKNTNGGERVAKGIKGSVLSGHYHFILMDDPLNITESGSDIKMKTTNSMVSKISTTRKVDKAITFTCMIMQRLHESDPAGMWLSKEGLNIKHINLPAKDNGNIKPKFLKTKYVDGLLDPIRLSEGVLSSQRLGLGSYDYEGQFQQEPAPSDGGIIKKGWFKFIDYSDLIKKSDNIIWNFEVDGAFTSDISNDQSAILSWCLIDNVMYIRDSTAVWEETNDFIKTLISNVQFNGYTNSSRIYIENKASGIVFLQVLKNQTQLNVIGEVPKGGKEERVKSVLPFLESGRCVLVRGNWNEEFINQCGVFPRGKLKDRVDTLTAAINRITESSNTVQSWGVSK